jgi:uncharacterized protein GlcG (DUF336 family)
MKRHRIAAVFLIAFSAAASAQSVRSERTISLALASEAAAAAVADCAAKGYTVAATVVDRAAQIKSVARGDNAGPHTIDSSRRKAYTSASLRIPTTQLLELSQKNPAAANLGQIDGFMLIGGGLPIRAGNEVIGGIGVGGAPGGHLDDACAQAGIDKIKDRLN